MWFAPLVSLVIIALLAYTNNEALNYATPILTLWLLAPALAWHLSQEETEKKANFSEAQVLFLHASARKTWSFFEEFVTAEQNWLPPDNFQEHPTPVIAHRTSPTNMGLSLLANLTAYDFGYITIKQLAERCDHTLRTMLRLEQYNGHFYNWYDTKSIFPLYPRYVSTVDSGNLVGHLLTLRQGLLSALNQPVFSNKLFEGLLTTARIIRDVSRGNDTKHTDKIITLLHDAVSEDTNSLRNVTDVPAMLTTRSHQATE